MATGNHPESGELILDPGKYLINVNKYSGPSWVTYRLTITASPAPPEDEGSSDSD